MNHTESLVKAYHCLDIAHNLEKIDDSFREYYIEKGYKINELYRLLVKNDLDHYTYILLSFFDTRYFKFYNEVQMQIRQLNHKKQIESIDNLILDTELLIFLLSNTNGKLTNINFQKNISSFNLSIGVNDHSIIDFLLNQYNYRNNNQFKINFHNEEDVVDAEIDNSQYSISRGYNRSNNGISIECAFLYVFNNPVLCLSEANQPQIDNYIEFLNIKLKYLKSTYKKKGAKLKDPQIQELCEQLSFLVRIDRYMKSPEFKYISDIVLTNSDCRIIHDILVFFGIIEDKSNTYSKTLPENYIRTKLKYTSDNEFYKEFTVSKIKGIHILRENNT